MHPVYIDGTEYKSVEHFYQSQKILNPNKKMEVINANTPGKAKNIARSIKIRYDWDDIKLNVMEKALRCKFQIPELRKKLLETGDAILEEGNNWHDKYWGIDLKTGMGENHLGKLLMKIREDLSKGL